MSEENVIRVNERSPEQWDVLDSEGRPTGRLALRGDVLANGDRHLVVHVYLVDDKGRWLIQKRSLSKEIFPGAWDITAGSGIAGEDSRTGAIREVEEELGLRLESEALAFVARLKRLDAFVDIWMGHLEVGLEALHPQPEEVDELRLVATEELLASICDPLEFDEEYAAVVENLLFCRA